MTSIDTAGSGASIDTLPLEVLELVLKLITLRTRISFGRVCKRWHRAVWNSVSHIRIGPRNALSNLSALQLCPSLTSLDLSGNVHISTSLRALSAMTKLRILDLSGCFQLTSAALGDITALTNLHTLRLDSCLRVRGDALSKSVSQLPALRTLSVLWCIGNLSPAAIGLLSQVEGLSIDSSGVTELTPDHQQRLKRLQLDMVPTTLPKSLDVITPALTALSVLNFDDRMMNPSHSIAQLTNLQSLAFGYASTVSAAPLASIVAPVVELYAGQLRSLSLEGLMTHWESVVVSTFTALTVLTSLSLVSIRLPRSVANASGELEAALSQLTALQRLRLHSVTVDHNNADGAIQTFVTNVAPRLSHLEQLELAFSTDQWTYDAHVLARIPRLRSLHVFDKCKDTLMRAALMSSFRRAMPQTSVSCVESVSPGTLIDDTGRVLDVLDPWW